METAAAQAVASSPEMQNMLSKVVGQFGDENTKNALQNIQTVLRKESSSTITDKGTGRGFSEIKLSLTKKAGVVRRNNMEKLIRLWLDDMKTEPGVANVLEKIFKECALIEEGVAQSFDLTFKKANGGIQFVQFGFRPSSKGGDNYDFVFGSMHGKFALAPDFVIIRKTKSSFLSSSTKDSIVYVPRPLTETDIANLMQAVNYCAPNLAFLGQETSQTPTITQ